MTHVNPTLLVLDTNVCLDLFVFEDRRCVWLLHALRGAELQAYTTGECRNEWLQVLSRPKLGLSISRQDAAQRAHDAWVRLVDGPNDPSGMQLPRCADADDQKFLVLAARLGARAVLTRDRALLVLSKRSHAMAGFVVRTPEQFAREWPIQTGPGAVA